MARRSLVFERLLQSQIDADNRDQPDLADFTDRLSAAMGRLSRELREGWKAREENRRLRQENEELREVLAACVDSCERFLGPTLDGVDLDDDEDHVRARAALLEGRRVLDAQAAPLLEARQLGGQ